MNGGQGLEEEESSIVQAPRLGIALREAAPFARARLLSNAIRERLGDRLGLLPSEIEDDSRFIDLGIDSMVAVEVQLFLAEETGVRLKSTVIFDYPTIGRLVTYIVQRMDADQPVVAPAQDAQAEPKKADKPQEVADVATALQNELREIQALVEGGRNG